MALEYFKEKLYPEDKRAEYRVRQSKKALEQAKKDKELYDKVEPVVGNLLAPRSYNDGLSLKNIGLDIMDWTPAAPLAYGADVALGDEEFSPLLAAGMIPFIGKFAKDGEKLYKGGKKVYDGLEMLPEQMYKQAAKEARAAGDLNRANSLSVKATKNKQGKVKYYSTPDLDNNKTTRISSRGRINATSDVQPVSLLVTEPNAPMNNGSNIVNTGSQIMNSNTIPSTPGHLGYNGNQGWQGAMYDPRRKPVNINEYGPFQWEDRYSMQLNDLLNSNETNYHYLANQTNRLRNPMSKDEAAALMRSTGRPDLFYLLDNTQYINPAPIPSVLRSLTPEEIAKTNRFKQIKTNLSHQGNDLTKYIDRQNRQVEKALREEFASLPNDPAIRYRFAEHYGTPDLYDDWIANPTEWNAYANTVKDNRSSREAAIRYADKRYQRDIAR